MTDVEDAADETLAAAKTALTAVRGAKARLQFNSALEALEAYEAAKAEVETAAVKLEDQIKALRTSYDAECKPARERMLAVFPSAMDATKQPPSQRAAYSDRTAALMSKFALLAYKRFEEADGRALLEALLGHADFKLLETFDYGSTQGFLASSKDFCVLAFRGTTSKADWKINQKIMPAKTQIPGHPRKVGVHGGFLSAFLPLEADIRVCLDEKTGNLPIYITGHSLGGALALIASAVLGGTRAGTTLQPLGDRIAAVYTFGAPRVGGQDFEDCVKAPHYRVVNKSDLVPWVPPSWLFGYRHSGDVRILRGYGERPSREQWPANLALTALWGGLLYLLGASYWMRARVEGVEDHAIKRYVAKLDRIAELRGAWK